ncbi:helix-turn-helix transcriptional regulator [Streptacidiphilus sp. PB12-B1b]|uniref:AraC family transcriptional regulator n=1 Tax=Streptacidiphilus sp. PB12-B1b TaxID=2705012 RepID=UPI0015FBC148|nr:helix-turn-helix transcriptional regulator [Streptacidiphilus sp. PB12-B1b]QMU77180.1 helix-turn-helix transcriptional regulator [Streptacidiphilus sp. PB12-B1b]
MSQNSLGPLAPTNAHDHAPGEVIDRHRHDYHQLVYVSRGVLAVQTEGGAWVACADRAVWIPADTWHEHRVYGHCSVHTLGFPAGEPPLPVAAPTIVAVDGLLRELLIASTEPGLPAPESQRLRAVLGDRLRRAHVQPLTLPVARDPRLAHACRLVADDLSRARTMAWLARSVGVGERTLTRLFRTEFGMSYPQWRTNTRVFHAMIQLAEGASVTATGQRCGWATASAFIDTFARTMGQTPGAYRAAAGLEPPTRP